MSAPKKKARDLIAVPVGIDATDEEMARLLDRRTPVGNVLDLYDETDAFIGGIEQQLVPAKSRRQILRIILDARLRDAKTTKLAHEGAPRASYQRGPATVDKRLTVLQKLTTLKHADGSPVIPPDELNKAIWLFVPEPEWKTHLTYLRKLAAYGEEVQKILAEGIVETPGVEVLVIAPRPMLNVTPLQKGIK